MTHVVTGNCNGCRFTECVTTCPVACFHADEEMLYINPDICIDCGACIPACPVQAIQDLITMPKEFDAWININAEKSMSLPEYTKSSPPYQLLNRKKPT